LSGAVDVVMVPDFAGPGRRIFEARTLLFLGSWLEQRGASCDWPLHLACVGDPPAGVASLAERCGARVSIRPELSLRGQRYLNKLRGLEVESATGRILLLDADTVVLMRRPFREPIPAHYNTGVLLVPADCRLREHWERVARLLDERYTGVDEQHDHIVRNDQPSLAVAAALLRDDGVPLRPLPYPLHGFDLLYAAGALTYEATAVYHAKTFFRRDKKAATLDPLREVQLYRDSQVPRLYPESPLQRLLRRLRGRPHPPAADSILGLCQRLEQLTRTYVLPGLT
jgi:hypothetical protein